MLENIAEDITFFLLKNRAIECEDSDIYIYGFQVILSSLMVTGALLILGVLLNKLLLTLIFILVFVLLRTNTGGYHAEKFKSCLSISLIIYLSEILLNIIIPINFKIAIGTILLIVGTSIIYINAPVEHKNNPLSFNEKRKYRKVSRILSLSISIITLICFYTSSILIDYCFIVSLTVMAVAILIIISLFRGGAEEYD